MISRVIITLLLLAAPAYAQCPDHHATQLPTISRSKVFERMPKLYMPKTKHLSVEQCVAYFVKHEKWGHRGEKGWGSGAEGFCEWYGGTDLPELCSGGYHQEQQQACYGFGAAEIPTFRTVCHRNDDRGAKEPCGLECAAR